MRRPRVPGFLLRWYRRHAFDVLLGGVAAAIVGALAIGILLRRHPTRESAAQHLAASVMAGQDPQLSDAELEALNERPEAKDSWSGVDVTPGTSRWRLDGPGLVALRVLYSDGFFTLSDTTFRLSAAEARTDPIDLAEETGAVVAGGPGEAMVSGCCEGGDARATVVLREEAPPAEPGRAWKEASEVDLDLAAGHLVFSSTGGTSAVVTVPKGAYRLRVSGVAAVEFEQERERFLIELWPRRYDLPVRVLRPNPLR